jgi:hypothetical protein
VCAFIETFGNQHHHQHHHLLWLLLLCPRRGCSVGGVSNKKQKSSHNKHHTLAIFYKNTHQPTFSEIQRQQVKKIESDFAKQNVALQA